MSETRREVQRLTEDDNEMTCIGCGDIKFSTWHPRIVNGKREEVCADCAPHFPKESTQAKLKRFAAEGPDVTRYR